MTKKLIVAMGLFSFLFGSCNKREPSSLDPSAVKFAAGQVWAFKTPPGQPNAKVTVLRVEDGGKLGSIVHIGLSGVSYGDGQTTIQHLPFSEAALAKSVTVLERENGPVPDFDEGYRLWREAFDAGKAGVFTVSVAEAFEMATRAVREGKQTH